MRRIRWKTLVAGTAGLAALSVALGGAALAAPAAGVKGDPQPELKPFTISSLGWGTPAGVAIEPSGSLVVAYAVPTGKGKFVVCMLNRGARNCARSVTLSAGAGAEPLDYPPQLFIPSANHVVVLMYSNAANGTGADLVFSSANGGRTFAAPVRVGNTVYPAAAALIGGQIVFSVDSIFGPRVEAIPVHPTGAPATTAIATTKSALSVAVGDYKGGALIGSLDNGSNPDTTYVQYAARGKNFNASASYHSVGSFPNEDLLAMSGSALLTEQTAGQRYLKVRLFNGTRFGAAHIVPGTGGGGPEWFGFNQDPSGRMHVFSDRAFAPVTYGLYERSSATGATWTGPVYLGDGTSSNSFGIALDSNGTGLVAGSDIGTHTEGFPVLAPQGASFSLRASAIKKGHTTTGYGKGSPVARNRGVALQVERSGLWYTIASTRESGTGGFSFTIRGTATGTRSYRAVVSSYAGYREYGYSAARTLKVS